jgi:uncharacterized iron-regulated membrane protein
MAEAALADALQNRPGSPAVYVTLPTGGRDSVGEISIYADPAPTAPGEAEPDPYEATLDAATLRPTDATAVRETSGGDVLYAMHYNLHYIPFESLTLFGFTLPAWPTLIVGVATMFMLVAIVTGIVVHKKIFADFFTFRPGKGQRSWLDAHNLSSVLALPFMVMITYSGLMMYTYEYMPTVKTAAYGLEPDARQIDCELYAYMCGVDEAAGVAASTAPVGPMIAQAEAATGKPANYLTFVNPGDENAAVLIYPQNGDKVGFEGPVLFAGATGEIIGGAAYPPHATMAVVDVFYALHEGNFAGPMLRWLYLLTGAVGCAMVATGLVLWSAKRRQKLRADARADFGLAFVERTNVGIIAGLLIAVAAYFWANRLLPVGMEGRAEWEVHVMFLTWGAMLVHSVLRPARKAWVEQWVIAALAYGLLPVLNAATTDIHLGRTLVSVQPDWVLASVDLSMIGLALFFACAARAAWRKQALAPTPRRTARTLMEPAE